MLSSTADLNMMMTNNAVMLDVRHYDGTPSQSRLTSTPPPNEITDPDYMGDIASWKHYHAWVALHITGNDPVDKQRAVDSMSYMFGKYFPPAFFPPPLSLSKNKMGIIACRVRKHSNTIYGDMT